MTPAEDAALQAHLYMVGPVNGVQYKSSFMGALRDARAVAERDVETGIVMPEAASGSWLGAIGYLVLLDQVGTCFTLPGCAPGDTSFIDALRCFSTVAHEPTIQALYAVRNALAHDYSLFNRNVGNPLRNHAFAYTADPGAPLIQLPAHPWNGQYANIGPEQTTTVNLRQVGDLVEEVVPRLRQEHQNGQLMIRLPLGEFEVRYGMYYPV